MFSRTRDQNNRDKRNSTIPETGGAGQGQVLPVMDDHRSPFWANVGHYEVNSNPYNLFLVPADGQGDWTTGRDLLGLWSGTSWVFDRFDVVNSVSLVSQDGTENIQFPLTVGQALWNYEQLYPMKVCREPAGFSATTGLINP